MKPRATPAIVMPAMVMQARKAIVDEKPDVVKRFLRAHAEAEFFAAQNHKLANEWFRSLEPAKGLPEEVIETSSNVDPQWNAKKIGDIHLAVSEERLKLMQGLAEWGGANKLLPAVPKVADYVNTALAAAVDQENAARSFDASSVKVVS